MCVVLRAFMHAHVMHTRVGSVSAHDRQLHKWSVPAGLRADKPLQFLAAHRHISCP